MYVNQWYHSASLTFLGIDTTLMYAPGATDGSTPVSYTHLDVYKRQLQELPPAPGLTPSDALDPLDGMRNALNCGLDFLNTAQRCGLSSPQEAAAPFTVHFNPTFCRLTLRFSIGELIDGLLRHWIAGAFARISSPFIGALCLLGIGCLLYTSRCV